MQQWWEALEQLYTLLQDSNALGVPREARKRLIASIGALDSALLDCARADCPIRSTVQDSRPVGGTKPAPGASSAGKPLRDEVEADATGHTCCTCRWWNQHRPDAAAGEGACLLTRTEATVTGVPSPALPNTLARAAAAEAGVGAVLITQMPYACSQWTPL